MSKKNGIVEQPEVQTPNTGYTEVNMAAQTNKASTATPATKKTEPAKNYTVQPSTYAEGVREQVTPQVQEPVENQANTNVVLPVSDDFNDAVVQQYMTDYQTGIQNNNYQAQINALSAIDAYRTSKGLTPKYGQTIYELNNQRNQKIEGIIQDYETQISDAVSRGDASAAVQIGQQMQAYKKSVNYQDNVKNATTYLQDIEYKNTYDDVINGILKELLTTRFTYDPSDDKALLKAQEYATNTAMEKMNAKGILDSTMTAQIVAATVSNLQVEYEKMAKEEFYNNIDRMKSMANFVIGLEETQYNRWLQNVQLNLEYYSAQRDEMAYQWDRVEKLGYVDNEASIILGVAPGMLSPSMRQAIQEAELATKQRYDELYSDIALAGAKQAIEDGRLVYNSATGQMQQVAGGSNGTTTDGKITPTTKFNGTLSATALKRQMEIMWEEDASDEELIQFARNNAKTYDAFVQAIGGTEDTYSYTLARANEILYGKKETTSVAGNQALINTGKFVGNTINKVTNTIGNMFKGKSENEKIIQQVISEQGGAVPANLPYIEKYLLENYEGEQLEELLNLLDKEMEG